MNSVLWIASGLARLKERSAAGRHARITLATIALLLAGCAGSGASAPDPAVAPSPGPFAAAAVPLPQTGPPQTYAYRLGGDRAVRPLRVSDDGARTTVAFAPEQALPAVFAIGPTGEEIVVNGHMRAGGYVIDRVHERLVFRIDGARATARRLEETGATR